MNALVWTGPEKMEIQQVSKPILKDGWVLIEVKAAGICGSDLSGYLGHNSLRVPPLIMGHEFSGTVVQIAKDVSEDLLGRSVTVNPLMSCGCCRACLAGNRQLCKQRKIIGIHYPGAFAQFVTVPANQCYPISDVFGGAMVEPLACSLRAVNRVKVQAGDLGIVIGAGIIGLMCIKLMKLIGAREVIAIDTNQLRLDEAKSWGATYLLNPQQQDLLNEIKAYFPEGADCIVDAVGASQTRQQAIESVRAGGRIVFIGLHEDSTYFAGNVIVREEIEIYGTFSYTDLEFSRAIDFVKHGILNVGEKSWLDIRPLANGAEAFKEQVSGAARYSKIILQP